MTSIRPMRQEDVAACAAIALENWDIYAARFAIVELGQMFGERAWRPFYYVAESAGAICGMGGYSTSMVDYGVFELIWINVRPANRGQRIGFDLVERCLEDVRRIGVLVTLATSIPEFYRKNWGFKSLTAFGPERRTFMALELCTVNPS